LYVFVISAVGLDYFSKLLPVLALWMRSLCERGIISCYTFFNRLLAISMQCNCTLCRAASVHASQCDCVGCHAASLSLPSLRLSSGNGSRNGDHILEKERHTPLIQAAIVSVSRTMSHQFIKQSVWLCWIFAIGFTICTLSRNFESRDFSNEKIPTAVSSDFIESLPRNTLLLLNGDNNVYLFRYAHYVEGRRPDVSVLPVNILSHTWFISKEKHNFPTVKFPNKFFQGRAAVPGGDHFGLKDLVDANWAPDRPVFDCGVEHLDIKDTTLKGFYYRRPWGHCFELRPVVAYPSPIPEEVVRRDLEDMKVIWANFTPTYRQIGELDPIKHTDVTWEFDLFHAWYVSRINFATLRWYHASDNLYVPLLEFLAQTADQILYPEEQPNAADLPPLMKQLILPINYKFFGIIYARWSVACRQFGDTACVKKYDRRMMLNFVEYRRFVHDDITITDAVQHMRHPLLQTPVDPWLD